MIVSPPIAFATGAGANSSCGQKVCQSVTLVTADRPVRSQQVTQRLDFRGASRLDLSSQVIGRNCKTRVVLWWEEVKPLGESDPVYSPSRLVPSSSVSGISSTRQS